MAVVSSLRLAPERLRIVGVDSNPRAAGFLKADGHAKVMPASAPEYLADLASLCRQWGVDAVVPTVDEEVERLAAHPDGAKVPAALPPGRSAALARDKVEYQYLGLPTPATLCTPVVVKPRTGRGARGFSVIDQPRMIVQERVEGDVYLAQGLCDRGRLLRVVVTRRLEPKVGPAVSAETVHDDGLVGALLTVVERLEWTGAIGVEFIRGPAKDYLIDVNPRICGQSHLATLAGVNLAYGLVQLTLGEEPTVPADYADGVKFVRVWEDTILGV